ncbi:MAG: hypothetical protein ACOH2A_10030 [Sphingobacteriaceae bacterium]
MKSIIFSFLVISVFNFSCSNETSKNEQPKPVLPVILSKTNADFDAEIQDFESMDKAIMPKKGGLVFAGTTAIRSYVDIADRLTDYPIVKRGLTESETSHLIYFADKIIIPYRPSILFIYEGEDDIVNGKTPDASFADFLKLSKLLTARLPETRIIYMSVKPSPGRAAFQKKFESYNSKVRLYISQQNCNWDYIDVYTPLVNSSGSAKEDLFEADRVTLNSKGYDLWEQQIKNYLKQ